jgi:thymidylate synthase (FAD)
MKHVVGCAWNEESARYSVVKDRFYVPETLREQNTSGNKQGSGGSHPDTDDFLMEIRHANYRAVELYQRMVAAGVAREQARTVLPQAMYTSCVWTASLQAIAHFLELRLDSHAQQEIQVYARAVQDLVEPLVGEAVTLA